MVILKGGAWLHVLLLQIPTGGESKSFIKAIQADLSGNRGGNLQAFTLFLLVKSEREILKNSKNWNVSPVGVRLTPFLPA